MKNVCSLNWGEGGQNRSIFSINAILSLNHHISTTFLGQKIGSAVGFLLQRSQKLIPNAEKRPIAEKKILQGNNFKILTANSVILSKHCSALFIFVSNCST